MARQDAPALAPIEFSRWIWRQLTSMRTALILLLLLALAAVPGSIVPQSDIDPIRVARWKAAHPDLTTVYDRLGLFSVYDSAWFSAVYILLMISLLGCIVPRLRVYARQVMARPPKAPRNLERLPAYACAEVERAVTLDEVRKALRASHFRVVVDEADGSIAAERGRLREAGNLLFHVAVVIVLIGFAVGQLFGYKGGAIVMVGSGFTNTTTQYDEFSAGSMFAIDDLRPLHFTVDDFNVDFLTSGAQMGQPESFAADLTYTSEPGAEDEKYTLEVNHPLILDGVSVFLIGHGYAPIITVKDGEGNVVDEGPVVFLPQDSTFLSYGVVKEPDARPDQLAFEGEFYPTYGFTMERGSFSAFPDWLDPRIVLLGYYGDLGMDSGIPQNVYDLDKTDLTKFERPGAKPDDPKGTDLRIVLEPGQGMTLPGNRGTIEFNGVQRWVKVQISHQPGKGWALLGVVLALLGLMGSLFVRSRRIWVRIREVEEGRTVVEVAGLNRTGSDEDLNAEVARVLAAIVDQKEQV
jgi:cytochrome c biogenesis protein